MKIHTLNANARGQLTPGFRQGVTEVDLASYLTPVPGARELPVDDLGRLFEKTIERHAEDAPRSDRWLAPRVHALLRLDRAEAADARMWAWLAADRFPDYVRWRFPGKGEEEEDETKRGTPLKRFVGQDRDNAVSRLWWGAELCRDGSDYGPAERSFIVQDVPNTWFSLDAFHHPACAQAALRILPTLAGRPVNRLSTALDHVLTTRQLDVIAPAAAPDTSAITDWRLTEIDVDALLGDTLPSGPDETPVEPGQIDEVEALIRGVAAQIGIELE